MENNMMTPQRLGVFAPIIGAVIVIFASLTLLAGLPPGDRIVGFAIGIIVLIAVTISIGLAGWYLLLSPLPNNLTVTPKPLISTLARNIIALFLTLGTLSIGIAGVWDEIWHVKYGIPFGEDFFWRPHLMLYFGFATLILTGGWSWWVVMSRGKGTLQQRFRQTPILGVTFLAGIYTLYSVGADPIWHKLYGSDLAPWSLPHLLILIMILTVAMMSIVFHKSLLPAREWRIKPNLLWREFLIVLVLVGAFIGYTIILTIQWYAAAEGSERQLNQIANYPDWLMAVFMTFLAVFFGSLALHATRQVGTATLLGVLAFGTRFMLDEGFGGLRNGTLPLWLILVLTVALDVCYAVAIYRTQKPPNIWITGAVIGLVFGVVGYPLIAALFPFTNSVVMHIPARVIASGLTAVAAIWLGQLLNGMSVYGHEAPADQPRLTPAWVNAGIYVAFAVFFIFFVTTATPPA